MKRALLVLAIALSWAAQGAAHQLIVSVLRVTELSPGEFVTSWQRLEDMPSSGAAYLLLRPQFPEHCSFTPPRLSCGARGLVGQLGFAGLDSVSSAALIQLERLERAPESYAFSTSQPRTLLRDVRQRAMGRVVLDFLGVGVEHIARGLDHLAFVLGLVLLLPSRLDLLVTISAFTLGHSISLAAATLGAVSLPAAPVEAVIALSIAFLALELSRRRRADQVGLAARLPWLMALGFGLLHGLGFANALAELALAGAQLPFALIGFNLGVELGQLAFVALVLGLGALLRRYAASASALLRPLSHYALGSLAMYWFFERLAAFPRP